MPLVKRIAEDALVCAAPNIQPAMLQFVNVKHPLLDDIPDLEKTRSKLRLFGDHTLRQKKEAFPA